MVSTASSGGSPWVSDQFTGNTHSGWSAHAAPTGRSATTGTPAARSTSCGPTPDSIRRCADPIAPADNTIRSAVRSRAPSGPTHSTPTALPPRSRTRPTRVLVSRVRLVRSIAGCRYAPPGPTRVPPLMFSGTAPTPVGNGSSRVAPLRSSIHRYPASPSRTHERRCATVEFGNTTNENRSVRPVQAGCRSRGRFRSRESAAARRPTSSPAIPSRRNPSGRPRQK